MLEIKENMVLMARKFEKSLKQIEKRQEKDASSWNRSDADRTCNRSYKNDDKTGKIREIQCYECGGFGHLKIDCPMAKRRDFKCHECKGMGHTRNECPSKKN